MTIQTLAKYHTFSAHETIDSTLPEPISLDCLADIVMKWKHVIDHHEHASIYYYGVAALHRRLMQLSRHPEIVHKVFGERTVYIVDIESAFLSEPKDYERILDSIPERNAVILFIGMDRQLKDDPSQVYAFLERYIQRSTHSLLLFYACDFLHPDFQPSLLYSNLLQNTIYHTIPTLKEAKQFARYLAAMWYVQITENEIEMIMKKTGGYFLLVKQALRALRDGKKFETVCDDSQMKMKLALIWESLLPSEKTVMKHIVCREQLTNEKEIHSNSFLQTTGWLHKKGNHTVCAIPLLTEWILDRFSRKSRLEIDEKGELNIQSIPVTKDFSKKESQLLIYLLTHPNVLLTREAIAEAIWKENWHEMYSDWSIDQIISRLRKKLTHLKVTSVIKTVKGKGIQFIP